MNLNFDVFSIFAIVALVVLGKIIKPFMLDENGDSKLIGKCKLTKFLPVIILVLSLIISIIYAFMTKEDLVLGLLKGIVHAGVAVLGYDTVKGAVNGGIK